MHVYEMGYNQQLEEEEVADHQVGASFPSYNVAVHQAYLGAWDQLGFLIAGT